MNAINSTGQSLPEVLRDVKIMAKRGSTLDYIAGVMGWSQDKTADFCRANDIAVKGLAARKSYAMLPAAAAATRGYYPRLPLDETRHRQVMFNTTPELEAQIQRTADAQCISKSRLLHRILQNIHARHLWADLCAPSQVESVASASPKQNQDS